MRPSCEPVGPGHLHHVSLGLGRGDARQRLHGVVVELARAERLGDRRQRPKSPGHPHHLPGGCHVVAAAPRQPVRRRLAVPGECGVLPGVELGQLRQHPALGGCNLARLLRDGIDQFPDGEAGYGARSINEHVFDSTNLCAQLQAAMQPKIITGTMAMRERLVCPYLRAIQVLPDGALPQGRPWTRQLRPKGPRATPNRPFGCLSSGPHTPLALAMLPGRHKRRQDSSTVSERDPGGV